MNYGSIAIVASAAVTGELFWLSKLVAPAGNVWQLLAQVSGLFGLLMLAWTYVLAVRHPFIERAFGGLDRVYAWHHIMGAGAFILIMQHPIMLMIRALPVNSFRTYFIPSGNIAYSLGILALYGLLLLIVLTLFVDLPYKIWKRTHEWTGMVIVLGAWHALIVPSDVSRFVPLGWWVGFVSGIAVFSFLYKRFMYHWLDRGVACRITDIRWEKDIVLLTITADHASRVLPAFTPGQFAFLSFYGSRDEHPFSVVSQDHGAVRFGIKITGEFTIKLAQAALGSRIRLRGPYGVFGIRKASIPHMVWIAGGIGVTPFMFLLRAIEQSQHLTFIIATRGDLPRMLFEPIEQLVSRLPSATVIRHDSAKDGRLTAGKVLAYTPIFRDTHVWLCGPKPLMDALSTELPLYGVKRHRIYFEDFTLK